MNSTLPLIQPATIDVAREARKLARDVARMSDDAIIDLLAIADEAGLADVLETCASTLADRLGLPDDE